MLENYVVIDLEMTGLSPSRDKIIEIGAVKVCGGKIQYEYQTLVNPNIVIPEKIVKMTGITTEMVKNSPYINQILKSFFDFIGEDVIIGHNLMFDFSFLMQAKYHMETEEKITLCGQSKKWYGMDTLKMARRFLDKKLSKRLEDLCHYYHIQDNHHHRAINDAIVTKFLYEKLCEEFETPERMIEPELYTYRPKKERLPSKREIARVERIIERLQIRQPKDIYRMNQSDLSRYADMLLSHRFDDE